MNAKAQFAPEPNALTSEEKLACLCVRDRIFETARELFYRQGIHQVGVEAIATKAGTTKMSLYRHFASKDDLVAACLTEDVRLFWEWWDSVVLPHQGNPRLQLESLFDAFQNDTCEVENARGCPLANAAVELPEPEHPGRKVIVEYKAEQRRRLREMCQQMGARNPDRLGDALVLLIEGSYVSGLVFNQNGPDSAVADTARMLIAAHLPVS